MHITSTPDLFYFRRLTLVLVFLLTCNLLSGCGTQHSEDVPSNRPLLTGAGSTIPHTGQNQFWLGVNYAWYNYGTDFGTGAWGKYTDWKAIDTDFGAMRTQGVHVVRWWVFSDGRYSPKFNKDGTVAGLDKSFLPDLDHALSIAAKYHIYLLLTVIDGNFWKKAAIDHTVQTGGHAAIVTDPTIQQTFLDNALKPCLLHIASSPNKSWVLAYDIVNEPEAQMGGYWGGSDLGIGQTRAFVKRCADYIHRYGSGAFATLGSATPGYVSTWTGLGLDIYQFHYYPWMDQGGPPGGGLPSYASLRLDRPCIVGEFATKDGSYRPGDLHPLSAQWYLDTIYKKGYAGALAWSFRVPDKATDWKAFSPVLAAWQKKHSSVIGP